MSLQVRKMRGAQAPGSVFRPRAASLARHWSLPWSAVAKLIAVPDWRWTNGAWWPESVPAKGFAALRKQSVHARLHPVAARRGTGNHLRYQTARGSPMWACWSPRTNARSRTPHPYSVSGVGWRLAWICWLALPGRPPQKHRPSARQYSIGSPSHHTAMSTEFVRTPSIRARKWRCDRQRSQEAPSRVMGCHDDTLRGACSAARGGSIPYVLHLLSVAALVLEDGGNADEAIAGLLHDAVEDQGGLPTLEAIQSRYGDRVADIVHACSTPRFGGNRDGRSARSGTSSLCTGPMLP